MNAFLSAALRYADLGFSVIPVVKGDKKPQIEWKEFQNRKATKEEITQWWGKWPDANVGIVTGAISGFDVIDFDRYKPNFNADIETQYFEASYTPTATSPRGGSHLYIKHDPELPGKADVFPGIDIRSEGNFIVAPPSQNGNGKPYVWLDGMGLGEIEIEAVPDSFKIAVNKNKYKNISKNSATAKNEDNDSQQRQQTTTTTTKDNIDYFSEGRRNEDMFSLAYALAKAGMSIDFIRKSLIGMAKECVPPYDEKETSIVITSAMDRAKNKFRNLSDEVREWVMTTSGEFLTTDVYKEFDLTTRDNKKHVVVILGRLLNEGVIEKVGKKKGQYRLVDQESPIIKVDGVNMLPYPVVFPLGVERLVLVHSSNIVIVAGESNSGKTGFCLRTAYMNRGKGYRVNYLSSEMQDGTELAIRLKAFGEVSWDGVDFRYRAEHFEDVIRPDDLNIVDYLEEVEEPWKMIQRIKDIGKKLVTGIAIICIQKHSKKQFGFGGEGTKNAARLYMTITNQNRLTIEKGKIWGNPLINPNGLFADFKLVNGCEFFMQKPFIPR